ncbi:MAG: ligase-associated DNA damage response endonuclease PdeM [Bacteroidia bacterium]
MEIEIRNQHFKLLPQKAVFWKEAKTLLVSDLHLGKVTHFRKEGIAIPTAVFEDNFKRLDELILTNNIYRIIFLGDLFHNRLNSEWEVFAKWRNKYHSVEMIIVLGNHDILPLRLFDENKIIVYTDEFREGQFLFAHHPKTKFENDIYIFCGHIHPVFCLRAKGRQNIKLPCFVFDEMQAVLPSFGIFTGGYEMKLTEFRKIFLITDREIVSV